MLHLITHGKNRAETEADIHAQAHRGTKNKQHIFMFIYNIDNCL